MDEIRLDFRYSSIAIITSLNLNFLFASHTFSRNL